jgi:hypothetical protein
LLGSKVTVLCPDVLELLGSRIHDLHIAREVLVAVHFREIAKGLVGDLGNIELVVANGQEIVINVLENRI